MAGRAEPQAAVTWLMPLGTVLQFFLPRWLIVRLARVAGSIVYHLNRAGRERFRDNCRHILGPKASESELDAVVRRLFVNLVTNYLDLLRTPVLRRRLAGLAEGDLGALDRAMAQGRGCVLVTAHLGNWDLAGALVAAHGYSMAAVVEPVPRGWARTFNRYRGATSMRTIAMHDHVGIAHALEEKRLLALVSDRDLTGRGILCPAFDAQRFYPKGPAAYSLKMKVPIVIGFLTFQNRPGRPPYLAHAKPLDFEPTGDTDVDVPALTRVIARNLNETIAQFPDQWLVFKAGWRTNPQ